MTDDELLDSWTSLDPTNGQRRRVDARVSAWLDAHDTSIAAEWLELVRVSPFGSLTLATVGATAIVTVTPLAWFAGMLVGAVP
ncbi:MAG: hypothetical protein ABS36_04675 [Acidobacteria bacterium SCN 69-37]|nr:MAG: hypothetical protein ABS36_04675 [Acidobacteria bacterium SCN 69-37]